MLLRSCLCVHTPGKYDTARADALTRPRSATVRLAACPTCAQTPCTCAQRKHRETVASESKLRCSSESPERVVARRLRRFRRRSASRRRSEPPPVTLHASLEADDAEWIAHANRRAEYSRRYWECKEDGEDTKACDAEEDGSASASDGARSEPCSRPLQPITDYLNLGFVKKRSVSVTIAKPAGASLAPKQLRVLSAHRRRQWLQNPNRVRLSLLAFRCLRHRWYCGVPKYFTLWQESVCMRSKSWLAASVWSQLARLPPPASRMRHSSRLRDTLAAAPGLLRLASVTEVVNFCSMGPKLRYTTVPDSHAASWKPTVDRAAGKSLPAGCHLADCCVHRRSAMRRTTTMLEAASR
jgi:hypothetical protein